MEDTPTDTKAFVPLFYQQILLYILIPLIMGGWAAGMMDSSYKSSLDCKIVLVFV